MSRSAWQRATKTARANYFNSPAGALRTRDTRRRTNPAARVAAHAVDVARRQAAALARGVLDSVVTAPVVAARSGERADPAARVAAHLPGVTRVRSATDAFGRQAHPAHQLRAFLPGLHARTTARVAALLARLTAGCSARDAGWCCRSSLGGRHRRGSGQRGNHCGRYRHALRRKRALRLEP